MLYFSDINEQVLNTLKSNTYSQMTDREITDSLNLMLFRAIADFRLPQISLEYRKVEPTNSFANSIEDYVFLNDVTQREINVILELVKLYWLEQQLDNENKFEDLYYDKDVKTYSRANLLKTLNERYEMAKKNVKTAQYNYSRVLNQTSALGTIYDE